MSTIYNVRLVLGVPYGDELIDGDDEPTEAVRAFCEKRHLDPGEFVDGLKDKDEDGEVGIFHEEVHDSVDSPVLGFLLSEGIGVSPREVWEQKAKLIPLLKELGIHEEDVKLYPMLWIF